MNGRHIVPFLTFPAEEFDELIESMHCSYGASTVGRDRDRYDDRICEWFAVIRDNRDRGGRLIDLHILYRGGFDIAR